MKMNGLALMAAASPDLEKQGFLAVVFVYREYSGQQESAPENSHVVVFEIVQYNGDYP